MNHSLLPKCMDCDLPYEKFGVDLTLSDTQWKLIHPTINGLLCANCIAKRASLLSNIIAIRAILELAE